MSQARSPLNPDVRVGFSLGTESFDLLLKVASRWDVLLRTESIAGSMRICVWAANKTLADHGRGRLPWLCWHNLALPESLDKYTKVRRSADAWSPWGLKSGPNFQFFNILERAALAHDETWLLLLELDTFPMNDPAGAVNDQVVEHPDSWVIGGLPHKLTEPQLDPSIRDHLNGAALYKVRSEGFSQFRRLVWIPSLLEGLRRSETLAFDCVTAPGYWSNLSPELRNAWQAARRHFVSSSGIINLSSARVEEWNVEEILNQSKFTLGLCEEMRGPWMLHAKTSNVDQLLRALARHTGP